MASRRWEQASSTAAGRRRTAGGAGRPPSRPSSTSRRTFSPTATPQKKLRLRRAAPEVPRLGQTWDGRHVRLAGRRGRPGGRPAVVRLPQEMLRLRRAAPQVPRGEAPPPRRRGESPPPPPGRRRGPRLARPYRVRTSAPALSSSSLSTHRRVCIAAVCPPWRSRCTSGRPMLQRSDAGMTFSVTMSLLLIPRAGFSGTRT